MAGTSRALFERIRSSPLPPPPTEAGFQEDLRPDRETQQRPAVLDELPLGGPVEVIDHLPLLTDPADPARNHSGARTADVRR